MEIDLTVDEGDHVGRGETAGDIRDAEVGDSLAVLGVVAGEAPDNRAAPVVADPNGALAAEMGKQVKHVVDAVLKRVIGMGAVAGGSAIAAHIRGDAAESEGGKAAKLVAPTMRELRPAVDEDNQLAGFGATGEIEAGVTVGFREVLGDREEHS